MTVLTDNQIKELCTRVDSFMVDESWKPMISPFVPHQVKQDDKGNKVISSGLSSAGYDVTLAEDFRVFTNINNVLVDPLNFNSESLVDKSGSYCIVPPNSYILGRTIETFTIPNDIMVICVGKSTYARVGILINVTPIEPGFSGQIVIEIANCTSLPVKVYANQGISQFIFFRANQDCDTSYADRLGKYNNQQGITLAKA